MLVVAIAMSHFFFFFFYIASRKRGIYKMHHLNIRCSAANFESQILSQVLHNL